MNMLFTNNRKLNYDEAVRRIAYWASQPSSERAKIGCAQNARGYVEA